MYAMYIYIYLLYLVLAVGKRSDNCKNEEEILVLKKLTLTYTLKF